MKVLIITPSGKLAPLGVRMNEEGDEATVRTSALTGDIKGKDFVITEIPLPNEDLPVVGGNENVPRSVLEAYGLKPLVLEDTKDLRENAFWLLRWVDAYAGWAGQTILSLPLWGMMNENLGTTVLGGFVSTFVPTDDSLVPEVLLEIMRKARYTGFLATKFVLKNDEPRLVAVSTEIPPELLYAVLEGTSSRLAEFFVENPTLLESWTVGITISRYPWPMQAKADRLFLPNLTNSMRRHLSLLYVQGTRKSTFFDSTYIGVSHAWAMSPFKANFRALRTCWELDIPGKQFRTDLAKTAIGRYERLSRLKIVPPWRVPDSLNVARMGADPTRMNQGVDDLEKVTTVDPVGEEAE